MFKKTEINPWFYIKVILYRFKGHFVQAKRSFCTGLKVILYRFKGHFVQVTPLQPLCTKGCRGS